MYAGEMNVAQDQLPASLKATEKLKVEGLVEGEQGKNKLREVYIINIRGPIGSNSKTLNY